MGDSGRGPVSGDVAVCVRGLAKPYGIVYMVPMSTKTIAIAVTSAFNS